MKGGECLLARSEWLPSNAFVAALIGPSGVGKSTLAEALCDKGLAAVQPTWATRGMRSSERHKPPCDHKFVAPDYFKSTDLLIARSLYGFNYGVPRLRQPADGRITLLVLKPPFIEELVSHFPYTRIYQIEASPRVAFARMQGRDQEYSPADIDRRMQEYESEIAEGRRFAHHVFNNDGFLDETLQALTEQMCYDHHALSLAGPAQAGGELAMLQ